MIIKEIRRGNNTSDLLINDNQITLNNENIYEYIKYLQSLDNIEIFMLNGSHKVLGKIYSNLPTVDDFRTKPYQYQLEGINYSLSEGRNKWLLLDAPGLGKTLQLIYLAQELKEKEGIEHCLIICGLNTLKNNWKDEIHKHSDMSCMILGESKNKKGKIRNG